MIDVRAIANATIQPVNPDELVTVKRSTGFTSGAGARQVPSYAAGVKGPANIQALDGKDLEQLDNISQQGDVRCIYLRGALAGIVRPKQVGGDLVIRADGSEWLVAKVFETWPTWARAAIVRQGPAP